MNTTETETLAGLTLNSWALVILFVTAISIFWRWHFAKDNHFDLMDLICTEGRLNDKKFARTTALVITSWGFWTMSSQGKMTTELLFAYGALWIGNAAIDKWQWMATLKQGTPVAKE